MLTVAKLLPMNTCRKIFFSFKYTVTGSFSILLQHMELIIYKVNLIYLPSYVYFWYLILRLNNIERYSDETR